MLPGIERAWSGEGWLGWPGLGLPRLAVCCLLSRLLAFAGLSWPSWACHQLAGLPPIYIRIEKQQKYKPVLTHGDFFLENLIYYKRLLYVIDHQDLHYNHPHLDIASLIFDSRRSYSQITEERLMRIYAKKQNINLKEFKESIHLVSLLRNLRILGNWVQLFDTGKPKYLKKYRTETWKQIFKHVEYLRFWDLREIFMYIYKKTK